MAWCENCKKDGFRKADVEFCYTTRKILCHGCYSLAHPGWAPPEEIVDATVIEAEVMPRVDYAVSFDSKDGFKAQVSYGELSLRFNAPMEQIKKYLEG
jgi:hypothetical protein